ncbi:MAG TPA: glutathione S-transferase, partial [Sulfitobacter sp.]|nr:glutathione S-transferase [Sulfitobacter sp.]
GRAKVHEWLMWQMGGLGPMAGQAHHFLQFNPGKAPYAETRYATEVQRLYGVLDKQLKGQDFICGDYSIADMACWPWVARYEWQRVDLTQFPNVLRWYKALRARDAVIKGYQVPKDVGEVPRGEP